MTKYLFDFEWEIKCCFDCPLFTGQRECRARDYRDNWDHADMRPEWCPLTPLTEGFVKTRQDYEEGHD